MNPHIILMQGLPASGKTTRAKQLQQKLAPAIRISRDDLREHILGNQPWTPFGENLVVALQETMTHQALLRGWVVIIDDTNTRQYNVERFHEIAKAHKVPLRIEVMDDVSVVDCILRDEDRARRGERFVGAEVIEKMHKEWTT